MERGNENIWQEFRKTIQAGRATDGEDYYEAGVRQALDMCLISIVQAKKDKKFCKDGMMQLLTIQQKLVINRDTNFWPTQQLLTFVAFLSGFR